MVSTISHIIHRFGFISIVYFTSAFLGFFMTGYLPVGFEVRPHTSQDHQPDHQITINALIGVASLSKCNFFHSLLRKSRIPSQKAPQAVFSTPLHRFAAEPDWSAISNYLIPLDIVSSICYKLSLDWLLTPWRAKLSSIGETKSITLAFKYPVMEFVYLVICIRASHFPELQSWRCLASSARCSASGSTGWWTIGSPTAAWPPSSSSAPPSPLSSRLITGDEDIGVGGRCHHVKMINREIGFKPPCETTTICWLLRV